MSIEFVLSKEQEELIQMKINSAINSAVEQNKSAKYIGREFLRLGEAAEYLGIDYKKLKIFTDKCGLKLSVIDGTKFISKKNIDNFMTSFEE